MTLISEAEVPQAAAPRAPLWITLAAVSLPMFMATLDNLVMTTALPVIQADLGASVSELSWFLNAYTLAFATFMLPAATLGDRIGRRRVMLLGVAVFTLASIASALSGSAEGLIAARAVQGIGAAAIMPLSLTLLAANVSARMRPVAIGIWGGVSGLGIALGPVIGGAVVEGVSWQAIFWLNVPVALVALPLIAWSVAESRGVWQRLDPVGTLLIGGAVFLGIWGIVHGNEDGWTSATVIGPLIAAGVLAPAYVLWARRRDYAVLPLRLYRSRAFSVANIVSLAFTAGMFGTVFLLSQYLQIVYGYSPLEAGVRTLPWTALPMVVAPLAGQLAGRIGVRPLLVIATTSLTASLVWLGAVAEAQSGYSSFVLPLLLAGFGSGIFFPVMATAVLEGLPESDFATASSANSTIREFGVALGIAMLVAVFEGAGGTLMPQGYDGAVGPALWVGAGAAGIGMIAAFFAPRRG